MHEFSFDLLFAVPCPADPDREHWANHYIEQLGEAGCTDATIGTGRPGFLSLGFDREAKNVREAIESAIRDVKFAIPQATLRSAGPDLVSAPEIARLLGQSPQNIRQKIATFRWPSGAGGNPNMWHLVTVLDEIIPRTREPSKLEHFQQLREISHYAMLINQQSERLSLPVDDDAEQTVSSWMSTNYPTSLHSNA